MASGKKSAVPELLKLTLTQKAEQLINDKFKVGLSIQAQAAKQHGFNYIEDIYTTWRGRYFYLCSKYRNPREKTTEASFEVRTTRLEYVGRQRFNLAYMRHTGKWCEVYQGLSLEESLETIENEELFRIGERITQTRSRSLRWTRHRDTSRESMVSDDRNDKAEPGMVPEVANHGIMRPPFIYLGAIVLGLLLQFVWSVRFAPRAVSVPLGATAVLVAVALFLSAVRTMRTAGTPVPGNRPTTTILRTGPYRYSRNPIYLSFSLLQLGVACWVNSLWLLITLIPAVALMSFVVIPREEHYLEARFPSDYLPYKAAVRRWL